MTKLPLSLIELLHDPAVTDLCFRSDFVSADRGNGMEVLAAPPWSEEGLKDWLIEELSLMGRSYDAKVPFIDGTLRAREGLPFAHRLHAIFPPVAGDRIQVSLRKLPRSAAGRPRVWAAAEGYAKLRGIVSRGDTLLISGSTGSGKTTLATELLSDVSPRERILALEDTAELFPDHPQFFSLLSRPPNADGFGEVTLRTLLKQTLRMRPDRIVLGECRGAEVLDLLQSLNTGHKGTLATLHANSPREALRRVELLCLLAGGSTITLSAIRELLAMGVQWIVQVERTSEGRRIRELAQVAGREGDTILLRGHPLSESEALHDFRPDRVRLA